MAQFDLVQTNFTRGELSPRLQGRLDFEGFFNGVAEMTNFLPVVQGAAIKRPGTKFVADEPITSGRLVPFEFNIDQTYILNFGDRRLTFYSFGEQLRANSTGISVQNGNFDVDLSGWTTSSGGNSSVSQNNDRAEFTVAAGETASLEQEISIASLTPKDLKHTLRFEVGVIEASKGQSIKFQIGSTSGGNDVFEREVAAGAHVINFQPQDNNGNRLDSVFIQFVVDSPDTDITVFVDNVAALSDEPISLPTPYTTIFVPEGTNIPVDQLTWAQSADVMFLAHPDTDPRELRRFAPKDFSLVFYDYEDGPWDEVNSTTTTLSTNAATGRVSVTASSTEGINDGQGFLSSDFGRLIRFRPDEEQSKEVQGDGSTNVFTFPFFAREPDDVRVTLTNTGSGTVQNIGEGATIEAIPGVDYSITLNESGGGGEVDFSISKPPASDIEINITRDETFWGWMEIIKVSSATEIEAIVRGEDQLAGTGPTEQWRLGQWTLTGTGFPQVVTFHDQRLAFGSSQRNAQGIWLSRVAGFNSHSPSAGDGTVSDDDAINVELATSEVNFVRWLSSMSNGLAIGTSGSEFLLRASSTAQVLSPSNIQVSKQTRRGSARFVPEANIGHSVFFVQRDRQTVREAAFDFDTNGLIATDLSVFSEHLLRPGISRMAYQQSPESVLWLLRDDGIVVGFTIESDQQVFSWTRHDFGGKVISIATITDPVSSDDQLWMIVEREINGQTVRYVERMEGFWFNDRDGIERAYYVDAGVTIDNGINKVGFVTGLDHLEGEKVAILGDGAVADRQVVQNGSVNIEVAESKRTPRFVQVGLPFRSKLKTFPYDQGQRGNTTKGKIKRISQIHILFFEAVGALFGRDELERIPFRDSSMEMDQPVEPFTGEKSVALSGRHDERAFVRIESDQPLPVSVLTLTVEMEFTDT